MIEFPEPKKDDREIFKISPKSLCHSCDYLDDKCNNKVMIYCETDSKTKTAFVKKCDRYEEEK